MTASPRRVRDRTWILAIAGGILLGGCAIRTPGRPPLDPGRESVVSPAGLRWVAPEPTPPESVQPRGFGVHGPNRKPVPLRRVADASDAEIWRPVDVLPTSMFRMIDPSSIAGMDAWIAILELSPDDPTFDRRVPPRRAVDALLVRPRVEPPRGLVILLGSLARLNPPEQWLADELLRRGWTVVISSPPVAAPDERTGGRTVLESGIDPVRAGRRLAREVDTALGAWRAGLGRLIDRLEAEDRLPTGPTVVIGTSSGALAAPLVADRIADHRPLDAIVLIAGGASPPRIIARTTLDDEDLRLDRRGPRVDDLQLPRFVEAFESSSRLQSPAAETAIRQRLEGIPTLVLEAGLDSAIPQTARDRLRAGLPGAEHWWYPLGHYGLFLALAIEKGPLADWIERVVAESSNRPASRSEDPLP